MDDVRRLPVGERIERDSEEIRVILDDLAREGARRMIAAALEAEVDEYVAAFTDELDEEGHRLVVRNGRGKQRRVTVGSGTLPLRAPRVNDKRIDEESGERQRFSSRILPRYARRSPRVTDVLAVLYLRGLSSGDFGPALRDLLGEDVSGLSASSIQRLTERWREEHRAFTRRRLDFVRYAYLFADGVHVSVRLGEDKRLCLLVIIGVREDGAKELLAVEDGYRESTDSWAEVLRDLKARGLNELKLVCADGALGLWGALRDVFPGAPRAALLGAQDSQRARRAAQARAAPGQADAAQDRRSADPQGRQPGDRRLRGRVRGQVAQGRRQADQRPRSAARVL